MRTALILSSAIILSGIIVATGGPSPDRVHSPEAQHTPQAAADYVGRAEAVSAALRAIREEGDEAADLHQFYAARRYQPAWVGEEGRAAAEVLIEAIRQADAHGLREADYVLPGSIWQPGAPAGRQDAASDYAADVQLTAAILQFASDLTHGPGTDEASRVRDLRVTEVLQDARDAKTARLALQRLAPQHDAYRALRSGLEEYRGIAAAGGWPTIPEGVLLRLDDSQSPEASEMTAEAEEDVEHSQAVEALCGRLRATGELSQGEYEEACAFEGAAVYGERLEEAVRRFQARHGLEVDGIVGPATIAAMNLPVEHRIAQIEVNLDRWRRLPDDMGRRHVHVNIPAFRLEAVEDGRPALEMRVVTGEPDWQTPVMVDAISFLEFSPYWNVPDSITQRTLLPQIRRNPAYVRQQGFDVIRGWGEPVQIVDPSTVNWHASPFPYRLRQRPGPNNALGLVKFMFPNDDAIYLHDTPAEHRFEERRRAFSHGCVRVEDPVALSVFLLGRQGWDEEAVKAAMHNGEREVVTLDEEVPVYLSYFTAFVSEDRVQFRPDIYDLDDEAIARLEKR